MPKTKLGKWSVGLFVLYLVIFFFPFANLPIPSVGFLEVGIKSIFALATIIPGIISVMRDKERAIFVYLVVAIGLFGLLFPLLFVLGEVLFPHD